MRSYTALVDCGRGQGGIPGVESAPSSPQGSLPIPPPHPGDSAAKVQSHPTQFQGLTWKVPSSLLQVGQHGPHLQRLVHGSAQAQAIKVLSAPGRQRLLQEQGQQG